VKVDTREADARDGRRATPAPFQSGGASFAFGGPTTATVSFDPAADGPAGGPNPAANLPQAGSYVSVLRRQIRAALRAGSLGGSGAFYRVRAEGRDFARDAAEPPATAANPAAGGVLLDVGEDAPRVDVLSLDDTPFGQWLARAQSEAEEGVSSFYTDLAGDFVGARRVANPRATLVVPDVRRPADDSEPNAYSLPDAVLFDTSFTRPAAGLSTILASTSRESPMFSRHYVGTGSKRQDANESEIPAGEGVEALPMGVMQNVLKWGQANPILAGLIAGIFAVMLGAVVARNPGQPANAE
jgi:hypothetical protein